MRLRCVFAICVRRVLVHFGHVVWRARGICVSDDGVVERPVVRAVRVAGAEMDTEGAPRSV
jgi:hypothetical protein